ncbi:efflux RND transporter periplasmic adaptor subunit [bacterium]|nr:efflux RND transporter periplasmic adaptor subunit [bacterium]
MSNKKTFWGMAIAAIVVAAFGIGWVLGSGGAELPPTQAYASEGASKNEAHDDHGEDKHGEKPGAHDEKGAAHEEHGEEGVIRLSDAVLKEFGIEIATAGSGSLRHELTLPGEVGLNTDRLAHVNPRFAGVIREVRRSLGDRVGAGQILAVMESNESLSNYEIKAPISGTIIERHAHVGELHQDAEPLFVIADLSTVWVDLRIYQKDLPHVRKGQAVNISTGTDQPDYEGTISYLGPVVSEDTRTALARVVVKNAENSLRPGTFVTARVTVDETQLPLVIPQSAIQTIEDKASVFVQTEEGFRPVPITTGRTTPDQAEVLTGLQTGQQYAAKGAFTLKAQLSKASFGDGHNH